MAKKRIEVEEVVVPEEEKDEGMSKLGKFFLCLALLCVGGVSAFAAKKLKGEDTPAPANDLFRAPAQPVVPHADPAPVEEVELPVVEEAAPEAPEAPAEAPAEDDVVLPPYDENATYVGNYDTKVFHTKDCRMGSRIVEGRKVSLYSVEEAFAADYKPCGICKPNGTGEYVCNTESMVFHLANCASVNVMLDDKKYFMGTREQAIAANYKPCGRCKP